MAVVDFDGMWSTPTAPAIAFPSRSLGTSVWGQHMPVSDDYLNYVLDQLSCAGQVVPKKMFGGVGLYLDGLFFSLIADNVLYFKVDDSNRADFKEEGMGPFRPYGKKSYAMNYYEVPVDVLEEGEKLTIWVKKALAVAMKKNQKKRNRS